MLKFIATYDLHFGFERKSGHKVAIHDAKAWNAVLKFASDFKPDQWIVGGDFLDCGVVSHHNHGKPGRTEGLRLLADATEGREAFVKPIEALCKGKKTYIRGNHEAWLTDLTDLMPSLEGIVDLEPLLGLKDWNIIEQGGVYNLGKLSFIHGDTIKGGEHVAKAAVINYERSIRFGHFHTFQTYTKSSPLDYKAGHTGIAVPCLCTKTPAYGKGAPNKWVQGFLFGYVDGQGFYNDYVVTIINGKFTVNGKTYIG